MKLLQLLLWLLLLQRGKLLHVLRLLLLLVQLLLQQLLLLLLWNYLNGRRNVTFLLHLLCGLWGNHRQLLLLHHKWTRLYRDL